MKQCRIILSILLISIMLGGCGNTGSLYLPDEDKKSTTEDEGKPKTGAAIWMKKS